MHTFTDRVLAWLARNDQKETAVKTKISILREHMAAGQWREAIRVAARFPQLGEHRGDILDAHMAYTNPNFCRGIRKDPERLIAAGIAALKERYQA